MKYLRGRFSKRKNEIGRENFEARPLTRVVAPPTRVCVHKKHHRAEILENLRTSCCSTVDESAR